MKKQLLLILLTLLPMVVKADEVEADGIYYMLNSVENIATVIGSYYDYTGGLDIPESISVEGKDYSVTSIGDFAFSGRSTLTNIYIPNSVTSIGQDAFRGCSALSSITIPDGVTNIEQNTFRDCSMLTTINIPAGVTTIGKNAFYGCSRLTSISIPNSVTSIGSSAFNSCIALTSVTINCKEIGSWFAGSAIKEVYLGDNVESIGDYAFTDCYAIISMTIPNSVTSIGEHAFDGCSGLTSITIPNGVTSIGNAAFAGCSGISSLELHCYSIGSWFRDNTSIKEVIIGNEVTSIGVRAFSGCSGLTSITIPNSVTSIGNNAFYGCSGLNSISIPNSVTSIGEGAFQGCSRITTINIPYGLNLISGSIFKGCSSLTSVTIPIGVTNIGGEAFHGCTDLRTVSIPRSVTSIGQEAFDGCYNLKEVYRFIDDIASWCEEDPISDSGSNLLVNSPERNLHLCLNDETEIINLIIPEGVKSIRNFAFKNCSGLISVSIPASVSSIGESAFMYCTGIKALNIPNSVTSISTHAFYCCTNLASVTIPNSVAFIGNRAFSWCDNLLIVNSEIAEPFNCTDLFSDNTYRKGTLYVPAGTMDLYTRFYGWREFLKIEEVGGEPQKFQLSFVVDNKELSKQETEEGATITAPMLDDNGNTISWYTYPQTMPAHDLVVYGIVEKQEPAKYTLSYTLDGSEYKSLVLEEGASISRETAPYKEGYTFSGWQDEPTTMPGNDVTVNGTFSVNSYSLKFVVDNTELSAQSVQYGSTITAPIKDSEGNDIAWYTYPTTMPAHDLVIYGIAIIQPEPEVFVWLTVKDGQSGTTKIEVKQGTEQRLNINPEEGWKLSAIMMDNNDVTAQLQSDGTFVTPALSSDATLTIVYEQETPSGVRTTTHSQAQIKVVSDGVVISNAVPDTRCVVYQTDGQQVVNTVINEGTRKITLQKGQAYILSIDGRTLKFAL